MILRSTVDGHVTSMTRVLYRYVHVYIYIIIYIYICVCLYVFVSFCRHTCIAYRCIYYSVYACMRLREKINMNHGIFGSYTK